MANMPRSLSRGGSTGCGLGNWNKELGRNGCDSLSRPGIPFGCRLVMAQRDPAAQGNLPGINLTKGEDAAGGRIMDFARADIAVNRLLNLTLQFCSDSNRVRGLFDEPSFRAR
jgi:hypothetical protein